MATTPSYAHASGRWWEKWAKHSFASTADGIRIHYVDVGPRDGLPVVLVHGWPDMWFGWRHQIQALSPTYRLIVPDMRGFGQSSAPKNLEAYGGKNVTGDFAALLDALDIEKAVFIGHDWGGAMVWRMCLYHPERVLAVAGVCTPYTPPHDQYMSIDTVVKLVPQFAYQKVLADAENTGKVLDATPKRFFTAMFRRNREFPKDVKPIGLLSILKGLGTKRDHPVYTQPSVLLSEDELNYYVEQYSINGFHSTCHYYGSRKIDYDNEKDLPKIISHKALFIGAANDTVLRPEMAKKMPSVMPNLEMKLVQDAGHWILWEQKEQVNALLGEWLQTIEVPKSNKRQAKLQILKREQGIGQFKHSSSSMPAQLFDWRVTIWMRVNDFVAMNRSQWTFHFDDDFAVQFETAPFAICDHSISRGHRFTQPADHASTQRCLLVLIPKLTFLRTPAPPLKFQQTAMNLRVISSTLASLAALQIPGVDAHGYLVKPVAEFLSTAGDITQYSATFQGTSVYPSGSFSAAPADNVKSFITNFADGQYSDIKTMILDHQVVVSGAATDCGFSTPKTEQTLSSSVWWGKNTDLTGEGFVESHEGPCEAWCDDVMVMQNTNCATAYNTAGKAAEVPIDNSKCSGASRFTFYWIAMHTNEWQVYINCLALSGSTSTGTTTTTTTTTPASTTATPTSTTATPTSTTATPTTTTATPTTTTTTPTTTTATPASTTKSPSTTTKTPASTTKKSTKTTTTPTSAAKTPQASNSNASTNNGRQGSQKKAQTSTNFGTLLNSGNYTTGSVRPHN